MSLAEVRAEVNVLIAAANVPIVDADRLIFAVESFLTNGLHRPLVLWNVVSNLGEDHPGVALVARNDAPDELRGQMWLCHCLNTQSLATSLELLQTTYGVIHAAYVPSSPVADEPTYREFLKALEPLSSPHMQFMVQIPVTSPEQPHSLQKRNQLEQEASTQPGNLNPPTPKQPSLPPLPSDITDVCDPTLISKLNSAPPDSAEYTYCYHMLLVNYHAKLEHNKPKKTEAHPVEKIRQPPRRTSITPVTSEPNDDIVRPTKHRMKFIAQTFTKPSSNSEKTYAVEAQQSTCKGCLAALVPTQTLFRGAIWEGVEFCAYTGFLYCSRCHSNGAHTATIPARMIHLWDFAAYPVCKDAFSYLEVVWPQPIVCVSALNPTLFERVVALRIARQIRVQLQLFHDICKDCPAFQTAVSGIKPLMYHMETTEMYSLHDIFQFRKCGISSSRESEHSDVSSLYFDEFINALKNIRSICIQHVVRMCRTGCYTKAAKTCGRCQSAEPIFTFDINNAVSCPKCASLYHRSCYKLEPCRNCYPSSSPQKVAPPPPTSPNKKREIRQTKES